MAIFDANDITAAQHMAGTRYEEMVWPPLTPGARKTFISDFLAKYGGVPVTPRGDEDAPASGQDDIKRRCVALLLVCTWGVASFPCRPGLTKPCCAIMSP